MDDAGENFDTANMPTAGLDIGEYVILSILHQLPFVLNSTHNVNVDACLKRIDFFASAD